MTTTTCRCCTKCGQEFPRTNEFFDRDSIRKDGLHPWCKTCRSARARAFRQENPEVAKERSNRWRRNNPDYRKTEYWHEYDRQYDRANREKKTENQRRYRQENPERYRAYVRNYQAQKRANGGHVSTAEIRDQYERQGGRCYWCSVVVGDDFHLDHVIPLKRGGLHQIDNIVVACASCNMSKHDKLPYTEWIPQNPL